MRPGQGLLVVASNASVAASLPSRAFRNCSHVCSQTWLRQRRAATHLSLVPQGSACMTIRHAAALIAARDERGFALRKGSQGAAAWAVSAHLCRQAREHLQLHPALAAFLADEFASKPAFDQIHRDLDKGMVGQRQHNKLHKPRRLPSNRTCDLQRGTSDSAQETCPVHRGTFVLFRNRER